MKRPFYYGTVVLTGLALSFAGCSKKIAAAKTIPFQSSPITIDGRANDWSGTHFEFDPGLSARYAITNDNNNLYICITTLNQATQMKILKAGMKILLDPTGQKKEDCGISFPLASYQNNDDISTANNGLRADVKSIRKNVRLQQNQFLTFGFTNIPNGLNAINTQSNIALALDWDSDNTMTYEISVPLTTFYGKNPIPQDFAHNCTIGIIINALPKPIINGDTHMQTEGMGGGGGRGGGSRGGFGGNSNAYARNTIATSKEQKLWTKFALTATNTSNGQ